MDSNSNSNSNSTTTSVVDANGNSQVQVEEDGVSEDSSSSSGLQFFLIPKQTSSPFFQVVGSGCIDRARVLSLRGEEDDELKGRGGVSCTFVGPEFANADEQAQLIRALVEEVDAIDGMAIAITKPNHSPTLEAISLAVSKGIPVITFDSDDPSSERLAYVGTNNFAFGEALAKVLLQIDPTGGSYALISSNAPNVKEREDGVRFRLRKSNWVEHIESPGNCHDNATLSIELMRNFSNEPNNIKAIIPVGGWPMFNQGAQWSLFADDHPNVLTVCADTLPHQMDLLNRNKVNGLVGQIPFQMGVNALDLLLEYRRQDVTLIQSHDTVQTQSRNVIYGTELHEVITVPLDLPPPDIDHNYIGNLRYLGIVLWAIVTLVALACGVWTYFKRSHRVIRASQPFFLLVIVGGILITIATIMPLSFIPEQDTTANINDDRESFTLQKTEEDDTAVGVFVCTSPIWFFSIGFTTIFSALFAKTWRINKIFHNPAGFVRLSVTAKDVLWPFFLLLAANVLTLSLMTALAPLEYVRKDHLGTDAWNRIISTYGTCQSTTTRWGGALPYLLVLAVINLGALVVAIIQAYQARSIQSEFSESHYIAVTMICILQTIVIAGPVLALVGDQPEALYVVLVCAVFIICAVTLGCIFGPKIVNANEFDHRQSLKSTSRKSSSQNPRISLGGGGVHVFRGSTTARQEDGSGYHHHPPTGAASGNSTRSFHNDETDRTNTISRSAATHYSSGENLDNSNGHATSSENNNTPADDHGLRVWRSQISQIEH